MAPADTDPATSSNAVAPKIPIWPAPAVTELDPSPRLNGGSARGY
jgi:hypothetical protein